MGWEDVNWIGLVHDRDKWQTIETVMNLRVYKVREILE